MPVSTKMSSNSFLFWTLVQKNDKFCTFFGLVMYMCKYPKKHSDRKCDNRSKSEVESRKIELFWCTKPNKILNKLQSHDGQGTWLEKPVAEEAAELNAVEDGVVASPPGH
jgi:hypothetical protein